MQYGRQLYFIFVEELRITFITPPPLSVTFNRRRENVLKSRLDRRIRVSLLTSPVARIKQAFYFKGRLKRLTKRCEWISKKGIRDRLSSLSFFFFENGGRSPVYRDCYEIEDGTGAARDVHCDVKVTDKAGQAPRPVYLKNE